MKAFYKAPHPLYLFCIGLLIGLSPSLVGAVETKLTAQEQVMVEEYQTVSVLRQKLRELLDRQELENALQEGDDVYNSFQNLEQWLQNLQNNPGNQQMEELMKALEEFENHLAEVLQQQQQLASQLPMPSEMQNSQQIPLSSVMEQLKQMLAEGKFEEARDFLNQLLSMFDQQQQNLNEAISQYYDSKFSELSRQLSELARRAAEAQNRQGQLNQDLRQTLQYPSLPQNMQPQMELSQEQISQLIQQMQGALSQMENSPFMPTEQLQSLMQQSQEASQMTSQQIGNGIPQPAYASGQNTQNQLQQLQQALGNAQQQLQQMGRPQMRRQGSNGQKFWSEKGVRPLKFEYDFQANPQYREEIQQLNQENHPEITPRQQQYLQEIIK